MCDKDLTTNPEEWQSHKLMLDEMIKETKKRLKDLKVHLNKFEKKYIHGLLYSVINVCASPNR